MRLMWSPGSDDQPAIAVLGRRTTGFRLDWGNGLEASELRERAADCGEVEAGIISI